MEQRSTSPSTTLRALLVEDSEDDARLVVRQLRRGGYDPVVARVETAEEMRRLLKEETWDVVIADYSLPSFNAIHALEVLNETTLDIPFIILSGTIGEETAVEAMRAGAHDYIMKGSAARLLPAIERELREARDRTDRRSAEQALHRNERRFRSLIENSSDIITVVDPHGTILYESPSLDRLFGHTAGDMVGTNLRQHIHPDDTAAVLHAIRTPPEDPDTPIEFRFRDGKGNWRALEATLSHLLDNPDVGGVVLNCRDITARKMDEAMIRHLAYFDALTALPNRMLFNDRLAQALAHARRHGSGLCVMFFDLDRFKTINDTLGHGAGDELLRTVAERLVTAVREEDTVARLGGDEFLFLLPGIDSVEDAARVADKLLHLFAQPFIVLERELHVTGSIGISLFPMDGEDGETLVRNADTALYRAKELGRNRYQLYAPAMNVIAFKRLVIENSLRRALDGDELSLYYQPLVSMDGEETVGVEALVRWHHPDLGLVSPADFIPTAEETGLIVPLTRWVLRTACAHIKEWQQEGIAPDSVSVNVSARRFNDCSLPAMIADVLASSGVEGEHLNIELTESVMMENAEATIQTLQQLKKLGVKISIDDFGTGYSSLSYLKRLPIDTLKIDQSFVRDIPGDADGASIAMLIIAMAHNLKLSVVAEGVETSEQMSFLRSKSCDVMQGYFVSRPMPVQDIREFLRTHRRR